MRLLNSLVLAGTIAIGVCISIPAGAAVLDFDTVASGTLANAAAPSDISFVGAVFFPDVDGFGDDIPGTQKWRPDPDTPAITVDDPTNFSFGSAPSARNALNARFGPVLLQFTTAYSLASFSTTLDLSNLGSLVSLDIEFLDASGGVLRTLATQQSVPGFVASLTTPIDGVSAILLPGGAFYDNIALQAIPEPATYGLLGAGMAMLAMAVRRRPSA